MLIAEHSHTVIVDEETNFEFTEASVSIVIPGITDARDRRGALGILYAVCVIPLSRSVDHTSSVALYSHRDSLRWGRYGETHAGMAQFSASARLSIDGCVASSENSSVRSAFQGTGPATSSSLSPVATAAMW